MRQTVSGHTMPLLQRACCAKLAGHGMARVQVRLNYVVPACVASYSAAKRELNRSSDERRHGSGDRH